MEADVVGGGIVSLYNNQINSIQLDSEYDLERLKLIIKVLDSPYLATNAIRIVAESENSPELNITEVELRKNHNPYIVIELKNLPWRTGQRLSKLSFLCDYDIEMDIQVLHSERISGV